MHRNIKTAILGIAAAAALTATLAGCSTAPAHTATKPAAAPKTVATQIATPAAAPVKTDAPKPAVKATPATPQELAQTASGLSAAQYASLTQQVKALPRNLTYNDYLNSLATVAAKFGPNILLAEVYQSKCTYGQNAGNGRTYFELAGELAEPHECGTEDYEQSQAAALAQVASQASNLSSDIHYGQDKVIVVFG